MGEHLPDFKIKLSLKDHKLTENEENGMFYERQVGLYNDWGWHSAKSDKFPTKSSWKWMSPKFLVIEIFLSPTSFNKKRKGKKMRDTQWKVSRKKLTDK